MVAMSLKKHGIAALFSSLWLLQSAICNLQSAIAQEVQWRYDYNVARRESQEKGLPLVIDFGTENCFWCKKLDASTFRDPTVVQVMNERFIPLKIDAEREANLAQALRIENYPTVVLAGPDGKILGILTGYLDATKFYDNLQRVLASVTNPEWMVRDYQEATKAIAGSDFARAVALLKSVLEDGKDRPVQLKARQLLQELEKQAADRLARARQLEENRHTGEAIAALTELLRTYAGTRAVIEGGQLLSALANKPEIKELQRVRQARDLLAQAREDYKTQQFLCCMDRCEMLAARFGDLPEGAEAMQLVAEIKDNPEWMGKACDTLADRLGLLYLALAETWLRKGQPQQAVNYLERVMQTLPGTRHAEAARLRLSQIQGQMTRPAGLQEQ